MAARKCFLSGISAMAQGRRFQIDEAFGMKDSSSVPSLGRGDTPPTAPTGAGHRPLGVAADPSGAIAHYDLCDRTGRHLYNGDRCLLKSKKVLLVALHEESNCYDISYETSTDEMYF